MSSDADSVVEQQQEEEEDDEHEEENDDILMPMRQEPIKPRIRCVIELLAFTSSSP